MSKLSSCLGKLGERISDEDRTLITQHISDGRSEGDAVMAVLKLAADEFIEIVDMIEQAGADVARLEQPLREISDLQNRLLERLSTERRDLYDEINELTLQVQEYIDIDQQLQDYPGQLREFAEEQGMPPPNLPETVDLVNPVHRQQLWWAMLTDPRPEGAYQYRELLSEGVDSNGLLVGSTPIEVEAGYQAVQQRKQNLLAEIRKLRDRSREIKQRLETIFYGETRNPDRLYQQILVEVPWKVARAGEGDLYIRRHGKNAGMPSRERVSENDFAITFDKDVLMPDFMYYLLQFLQPNMQERLKGTAQQYLTADDINGVLANHFLGETLFQSEAGPRLQALHNLSAAGLAHSDKMGGLAVPSIAVMPEGTVATGFGEITLIGGEQLGDPQQVPLFDADAYAVRYPRPQYAPGARDLVHALVAEAEEWALRITGQQYVGLPDYILEFALRRPDAETLIDHFLNSNAAKAWFLSELYGENPQPTLQDVNPSFVWGWENPIIEFLQGDLSAENLAWEDPKRIKLMQDAAEAAKAAMRAYFQDQVDAGKWAKWLDAVPTAERGDRMDARIETYIQYSGLINEDGTLQFQAYERLKRDAERKGTTDISFVDTRTYLDARIEKRNAATEFKLWADEKVRGVMAEPRIKIGSRWYPYTLENIVRKMKGKLRGTEDFFPTEGMMRARAAKRIRKLDEARRRALEQIGTYEEVEEGRAIAQGMVFNWIREIVDWWPIVIQGHPQHYDAVNDAARSALVYWAQNKDNVSDLEAMRRGLERNGFEGPFPDEILQQGADAAAAVIAAPVPYFEAKPQRAVDLNEFAGAVIPHDTDPDTRAILRKHGMVIQEYERSASNAAEQRRVAVQNLQNQITNAGGRTLFQSELGFTSGLLNAARAMPLEQGPAADMYGTLRKMPGVRARELEWIGVKDYMEAMGTVRKSDLVAFIEANGLQIQEVMLAETSDTTTITEERAIDAWGEGRIHAGLLTHESYTDEQIAMQRTDPDNWVARMRWEDLTDEQKHQLMAHLQRQQGTNFGLFGTSEEQAAALDDWAEARSLFGDAMREGIPIDSAEFIEVQENLRRAHDVLRVTVAGYGYVDRGDGTYQIAAPEANYWQLQGGQNYREIILKMPQITDAEIKEALDVVIDEIANLTSTEQAALDDVVVARLPRRRIADYVTRRYNAFAELLNEDLVAVTADEFARANLSGSTLEKAYNTYQALKDKASNDFQSHVFSEYKNIIAWFRVNDRIGPNGERILFIEETQNDAAKAQRSWGIRSLWAQELMYERLRELNAQKNDLANDRDPDTNQIRNETQWKLTIDEIRLLESRLRTEENKAPPMPFYGSKWQELVVKRIIRMAVEEGYDQIAWTNGEQQVERYTKAKSIESIDAYTDMRFGREVRKIKMKRVEIGVQVPSYVEVEVNPETGEITYAGIGAPIHWQGKTLKYLLGDELADRLMVKGRIRLDTEDLEVGGEGLRDFYDKHFMAVVKRVARSLDDDAQVKAKSIPMENPVGVAYRLQHKHTTWGVMYAEKAQAERALERLVAHGRDLHMEIVTVPRQFTNQHGVTITEPMRDNARMGQTYLQDRHRASITFDKQGRGFIRMAKARDMTSFLHEGAHLWLNILAELQARDDASQRRIDDWAKILKHIGVNKAEEITAKEHEIFAKTYELYLMQGKAPTPELQSIYSEFAVWLRTTYKKLKLYFQGIELTPEISGVFDRMVATEEQILEAEKQQMLGPIFATAEQAGQTPEAFAVYREGAEAAHRQAVDTETDKQVKHDALAARRWYIDTRKTVKAEVEAEIHAMPVYIALNFLQRGKKPDGSPTDKRPFKISKESLLYLVKGDQETLNRLPRPYIYTTKADGVDVHVAADELNYTDANTMIQEIATARPMKDLIEAETDARMEAEYPDPSGSGELIAGAMISVHNDARAKVLAAELRYLAKLKKRDEKIVSATKRAADRIDREDKAAAKGLLPNRGELAIIKRIAQEQIAKMRIRFVNPNKYAVAEAKAGRKAWAAIEKRDYVTAYDQKLIQIRNHEAFRAATRARQRVGGIQKYLRKFDKKATRQRLHKYGLLEPILALLEGIDLRKRTLSDVDKNNALSEIAKQVEAGNLVVSPDFAARLVDYGRNYVDMTVEEFEELYSIIKQIEHKPKKRTKPIVNDEEVDFELVEKAIFDRIVEVKDVVEFGEHSDVPTLGESIQEGIYHALSTGAIARILDESRWGPVTRWIVTPIRRAYMEKLIPWMTEYQEAIAEIYLKHYNGPERGKLQDEEFRIEGIRRKLSKAHILAMALHWGSRGNRDALLGGMVKDVNGEIIGPAYPEASVNEALALLDARDWAFVQDMWDYIGSWWPEVSKAEKRRRGITPKKIEPMAFTMTTLDGTIVNLRGGYMHLYYDRKWSDKVKQHEIDEYDRKMRVGLYVSTNTRAGSTYERVKKHGLIVHLGLNTIDWHLREIIRDLAIGDEIQFAKDLLNSPAVKRALARTGNDQAERQLQLWLTDSAVGEMPAHNFWEKMAGYTRVGFTKSKLAFSITVMAIQITGVFQSAAFIGKRNFMHGVGQFLKNPAGWYNWVMETSKFMNTRYGPQQTYSQEVADAERFLQSQFGPVPTRFKRGVNWFSKYYFWGIAKMQSLVDVMTWLGAHYDGRNNRNLSEAEARLFADSMVEASQTSGMFGDRSALERGTLGDRTRQSQYVRLFVTLIGYMIRKQGLGYELSLEYGRNKTLGGAVNLATNLMLLFMVEGIVSQILYDNPPADEDEDVDALVAAQWVAMATLDSFIAGIPLVREVSNGRYGSGNTPVGVLATDLYKLLVQAAQGEVDKQAVMRAINVLGTALHLPSSQVNRAVEAYFADDPEWYEYFTGVRGND